MCNFNLSSGYILESNLFKLLIFYRVITNLQRDNDASSYSHTRFSTLSPRPWVVMVIIFHNFFFFFWCSKIKFFIIFNEDCVIITFYSGFIYLFIFKCTILGAHINSVTWDGIIGQSIKGSREAQNEFLSPHRDPYTRKLPPFFQNIGPKIFNSLKSVTTNMHRS